MGRVIKHDTERVATAVLTGTGKGGLLSKGYLRDGPAREYVGEGETTAYVITNEREGVVRERDGAETAITPGKGYRTITVVTDRRLVLLVGDADDGDERVTLPLVEVADARATEGELVVAMRSGETWRMDAGDGTVGTVAAFVREMAAGWTDLEGALDAVERTLVAATAHRDAGEYDAGIEAARMAKDRLAEAAEFVESLVDDWPADALARRVDSVRDRCVETLADVHVGHGRSLADRAKQSWEDQEWEAAHDAYDRARAEFEAVAALDADYHDRAEAVRDELERIDRATEKLQAAPLERAIKADRRAKEADDPAEVVADWRLARERYLETLALDESNPGDRFSCDPEKVSERVQTVTDQILATARDHGEEALAAGRWFLESGTPAVAREEATVARDVFENALAVATSGRPEEVTALEEWLADSEAILAAASEAAAGEPADVGDGSDDGDLTEPSPDAIDPPSVDDAADDGADEAASRVDLPNEDTVGATDTEQSSAKESSSGESARRAVKTEKPADETEAVVSDGSGTTGSVQDVSLEIRLRALDPGGFDALARELLVAEGWEPVEAPAGSSCALRGIPTESTLAPVAVWTIHRPIAGPVDTDQIEDVAARGADREETAMIVTSSPTTDEAARAATDASVRVFDRADIAEALDGPAPDLLERIRPQP